MSHKPLIAIRKIVSVGRVIAIALAARKAKRKVVTTNGCFDILHIGHVRNLEAARAQGDILIVGINSDASVRENKGALRPIIPARERAEVLAGLACVDYVFIFPEKTPLSWMRKLRPSVHVKGAGSEHSAAFASEKQVVEKGGGIVKIAFQTKNHSTSSIIGTILKRYKK